MAAAPPPSVCWSRRLDAAEPSRRVHVSSKPPVLEILGLLPVAWRIGKYIRRERKRGREPIFDLEGLDLHPPNPGPYGGVPLGGIGGGCICRSFNGDFRRWSLYPGRYKHGTVPADVFSVRIRRPMSDAATFVRVLSTSDGSDSGALRQWSWGIAPEQVTYHALYPRAWTVYDLRDHNVRLTCRQISPVIPNDYVNTCIPACTFVWTVENLGEDDVEVSLMFTFQNGDGGAGDVMFGSTFESHTPFQMNVQNSVCNSKRVAGVNMQKDKLTHIFSADVGENDESCFCPPTKEANYTTSPMSIAIAAQNDNGFHFSSCTRLVTSRQGLRAASSLWKTFEQSGDVCDMAQEDFDTLTGFTCGAAVCLRKTIPAASHDDFVFALSWDLPYVTFGGGSTFPRYYTRFFGRSGSAAPTIASYAIHAWERWETEIVNWQHSHIMNQQLPSWYRGQLFNELYFITDGGCVWTWSENGEPLIEEQEKLVSVNAGSCFVNTALINQVNECVRSCEGDQSIVGQFLYLEGHEYLMYNTYDVHFYASFAMLQLWPMLELSLQRDFARSVSLSDGRMRTMLGEGYVRPRKLQSRVPHDLGSPSELPWRMVNAYNFQDVSTWKDLGPKFVLQVYRDYRYVRNSNWHQSQGLGFLRAVYESCKQVMEGCLQFDNDGDGMIENEGCPDQTYDIWSVTGVSAYCGGLWCASCSAMSAMADILGDMDAKFRFSELAELSRKVYDEKLWNGQYFTYDSSGGVSSNSVMADQLAGQWYTRVCGLEPVTSPHKALSAFRTVFELNVRVFGAGRLLGAVNGMRPEGRVDDSTMQSREVWTGTTYAVAAAMMIEASAEELSAEEKKDLNTMAFLCAQGVHDAGWNRFGYFFCTPEAWERSGNYRSLGYMRPLAIWAMHYALNTKKN